MYKKFIIDKNLIDNIINFKNYFYKNNYKDLYINCNDIKEKIIIKLIDNNFSLIINNIILLNLNDYKVNNIIIVDCYLNYINFEIQNYIYLENITFKKNINFNKSLDFYNFKININNCISLKEILFENININLNQLLNNIYNLNNINFIFSNYNFINCNYFNNLQKLKFYNSYIKELPDTLINLIELDISDCNNLIKLPNNLINLKKLNIYYCNIKELPNNLYNLKYLCLFDCKKIKKIPNTLINLLELYISHCNNLIKLPHNLINLQKLDIYYCNNLIKLPNNLINLNFLSLNDCNIKKLPNNLINLQKLDIYNCYNIKKIPNTLINLKILDIKYLNFNYNKYEINFKNKKNYILNINNYNNLIKLYLQYCEIWSHYKEKGPTFTIDLQNNNDIKYYLNKTQGNILYHLYLKKKFKILVEFEHNDEILYNDIWYDIKRKKFDYNSNYCY